MKKKYFEPSIKVIEVETSNLMQSSNGNSLTEGEGEMPEEAETKKLLEWINW